MSTPTVRWNRYGGAAIAILGFIITRQFVAQTAQTESTFAFVLLSLPPLIIGLGLTVYGVVLAVGRFSSVYVRTVTLWCGVGTTLVVLLVVFMQAGATIPSSSVAGLGSSQLLVANLLLGGAVGGILIGDRSAANRRKQREIRRTANRAAFVNRLLRHDVINAAAIIDGHVDLLREHPGRDESITAIDTAADRINTTVEMVGQIATPDKDAELTTIDLRPILTSIVDEYNESTTDSRIRLNEIPDNVTVTADERLRLVFDELLENAVEYGGDQPVSIYVDSLPQAVAVTIEDVGPGLPEKQQALLESGVFPEYDDPSAGFGLQVVSLLVDCYDGRIETTGGSTANEPHRITIQLPRYAHSQSVTNRVGVRLPVLLRAVTAGLIAGIGMGVLFQLTTGLLPVIGALYGVAHAGIGWVTHLFHSVIFAILFVTGCTSANIEQHVSTLPQMTVAGLGWGVVLWFVAAGFVMPAWLLALGEAAELPTLDLVGLAAHGLWGITLGGSYRLFARSEWFERLSKRITDSGAP